MATTDLFIKKPVVALVVSLAIVLIGLGAFMQLAIRDRKSVV